MKEWRKMEDGECGRRGGYFECANIGDDVLALIYKMVSVGLCPPLSGQVGVDCMVRPPQEGDESYALWKQETDATHAALAARTKLMSERLNALPGVSCVDSPGALYLYPRLSIPDKAAEAARAAGKQPDEFYALQLLDETGICVVAGVGVEEYVGSLERFHLGFMERVRFKQDEVQPSHLERVDNQFPEIWKASIKQYEADTKNNLTHASRGLSDIASADELLKAIDDKQKNFVEYRKRGAKIKGALKSVLDIVGPLASAAGDGVALVFPPGKVIFVAVKLLVDATHNVKSHYDAIIDIFEQMQSFLLRCHLYLSHGGNISDDLRQKLGKILAHLLSVIGLVTKEMKKGQLRHFIHGVFTKNSAIQDALARLDYLTKEESQVVQAATYQEMKHASRAMDQIGKKLDKVYENIKLDACYSWLAATSDPWINQNAAQGKLSESSTGQWFLQDQRFMEWKDQRQSSIWLYGKPGGGKTVLCSTIIKMLQDHTKSKTSCALAFFYFDFKDSAKPNFLHMLKSLLRQLCSQSLEASTVLKQLHADHDNGARQPGRQDLQTALGDMLMHFDDVYIVLDALDECHGDDRNQCLLPFLEVVMKLISKSAWRQRSLMQSILETD
ncbi:hypothetical protein EVG20_g8826 [Dentipellis fragilis]|uniref:NACHT domain-containing protein n=1 Tax=Dentipellis fragilis TaxID=205917 RepID=A0A4Y9Y3M8_9AGAM|nr:hypothetical protein EVG20_g8826 [Dentipellis fragilis]